MKEVGFRELRAPWPCARGTWLHRHAKAAKLQRVVQARESFLISVRAADRGRRWGRHRVPGALAWPRIALSIFQCPEFDIAGLRMLPNPRSCRNSPAHSKPRGREIE